MGSSEAEDSASDISHKCPDGHPVGENDLFCPVCLAVIRRAPATYWTVNGGRDDLHPSCAPAGPSDKEEPARRPGRYRQPKRH